MVGGVDAGDVLEEARLRDFRLAHAEFAVFLRRTRPVRRAAGRTDTDHRRRRRRRPELEDGARRRRLGRRQADVGRVGRQHLHLMQSTTHTHTLTVVFRNKRETMVGRFFFVFVFFYLIEELLGAARAIEAEAGDDAVVGGEAHRVERRLRGLVVGQVVDRVPPQREARVPTGPFAYAPFAYHQWSVGWLLLLLLLLLFCFASLTPMSDLYSPMASWSIGGGGACR